jgi:hypothetical protein
VVFAWAAATDAGGIRDYTVTWYDDGTCTGTATAVPGVTALHYALAIGNHDVRSFKLTAYDNAGNHADSGCSGAFTVDQNPPPALQLFAGTSGDSLPTTQTVGTNDIEVTYPADLTDVHHLELRRVPGNTPPADCTSGTVSTVVAKAAMTAGGNVHLSDQTNTALGTFSYRACVVDAAGNATSPDGSGVDPAHTVVSLTSKAHIMFTTHDAYPGDLGGGGVGGVSRGDARCKAAAAASNKLRVSVEPHWAAVLSDSTVDAKTHVNALGTVLRSDYDALNYPIVMTFPNYLWTSATTWGPELDENANQPGAPYAAWTGTTGTGTKKTDTCDDWNDGSNAHNGTEGDSSAWVSPAWLDNATTACDQTRHLYCISVP